MINSRTWSILIVYKTQRIEKHSYGARMTENTNTTLEEEAVAVGGDKIAANVNLRRTETNNGHAADCERAWQLAIWFSGCEERRAEAWCVKPWSEFSSANRLIPPMT